MIQNILILVLFILALGFISRKIYKDFTAKDNCAKGCASCDLSKEKVS